jgi:hypothetical protein
VLTVGVNSQTMDPRVYNGFRRHPADSPATLGGSVVVIPCSGGLGGTIRGNLNLNVLWIRLLKRYQGGGCPGACW